MQVRRLTKSELQMRNSRLGDTFKELLVNSVMSILPQLKTKSQEKIPKVSSLVKFSSILRVAFQQTGGTHKEQCKLS